MTVALAARLVLAAVFGVAAAAKLADRDGTRRTLREFGVPAALLVPAAILLPLAEATVAVGLLVNDTVRIAAALTLALLAAFTGAVLEAIARGQAPDCHCFGQLHARPVGRGTVARNAGLAALAGLVLVAGPGDPSTPVLLAAGVATAVTAIAAALRPRRGARRPLLPIGAPAPDLDLTAPSGTSVGLSEVLTTGRRAVLTHTSPACPSCEALASDIPRWQRAFVRELDLLLLSSGGPDVLTYGVSGEQFAERYGVGSTPSAVLIDREGRIEVAPVVGAPAVESLIRRATRKRRRDSTTRRVPLRRRRAASLAFEAYGVGIAVRCEPAELLDEVRGILPPGSRETSDRAPEAHFMLSGDEERGYEVRSGDVLVGAGADRDVALGVLDAKLRAAISTHAPGRIFVHAGVVAVGDRALVVPGDSFSGKTTLVRALIAGGASYFSDEYAVLDAAGRVHPYPKPLSIRNGASNGSTTDVAPDTIGAPIGSSAADIAVVAVAPYTPGATWRPERHSASNAALALLAHTVVAREQPQEAMAVVSRAAANACLVEGERGEAEAVAAELVATLRERV